MLDQTEELIQPMIGERSSLYIKGDECDVSGIQQPTGKIVFHNRNILVMKVKGHNYWAARGLSSYAPAEFQTYDVSRAERIAHGSGAVTYRNCYAVGAWDVRQDKKHDHPKCSECSGKRDEWKKIKK